MRRPQRLARIGETHATCQTQESGWVARKAVQTLLPLDVKKRAGWLSSLQVVKGVGMYMPLGRHLPDPVMGVTRQQHDRTSDTRRAVDAIAFAVPRSGSFFQRPSTLSLAF